MSTQNRNLSDNHLDNYPNAKKWNFGVLTAEWNPEVTHALRDAAVKLLQENGVNPEHIVSQDVPGSFELIHGAKIMAETGRFDAIICFGCIIQGETRHFDFIAQGVTQGIADLNIKYNIPFVFGVLTTNDQQQALDRAGGKHGNKGDEAAAAALKMIQLKQSL
ncbi:MAG: 6,7-dimethyl-8-ribityllumazine synthase [Bacteroidales bacterium]|jgi:6,7-dimethyl-8-ribityllumazine synthase|nr:6,7-dimethyl-8-ribityllumazine synthase [Bacteroidales bacterium]